MYHDPQNILVIHIAGLGETVLALPALRALRRHLLHSRITVAASAAAAELVRLAECADEVLPVGRLRGAEVIGTRSLYRSVKSLREAARERYDLAIELRPGTEAAVLINFARPQRRLNPAGNGVRSLIGRLAGALAKFPAGQKHQAKRYLEMLEPLGVRPLEAAPKLATGREADERIDRLLRKNGLTTGELLVGIHPGSGSARKRWPAERFASIAARLIHNFNARVIVFAGPRERGLAKQIAAGLPKGRAVVLESPKTPDFVSALARLSVFIGNHSGPAHVAAAVGTPVVAVSATDGPSPDDLLGRNHAHIRGVSAETISEERVYEAACSLIQTSRAEILITL